MQRKYRRPRIAFQTAKDFQNEKMPHGKDQIQVTLNKTRSQGKKANKGCGCKMLVKISEGFTTVSYPLSARPNDF